MKKQKLFILIMVLVLAGLLAVWYFAGRQQSTEQNEPQETTTAAVSKLFDFKATDVASITIINEADEIRLKSEVISIDGKEELTWKMVDNFGLPYDENRLATLASDLIGLTVDKEIAKNADNLAAYGLDDAKLTVSLSLQSGETLKIAIGDTLSSGNSEYVSIDDRIVSVSSSSLTDLREGQLYWLDRSAVLGVSYNKIERFSLSRDRDGLELEATCEFIGNEGDSETPALSFEMISPVNNAGDDSALGKLLQQLAAVRASEYVEIEPHDLSIYGLDKPAYIFEIEAAEGTAEIMIGASAGTGKAFALSSLVDGVFTVDLASLTSIDIPLEDLMDPFVSLHNIGSVSRIEADIYGTSFAVDLDIEQGKSASDENAVFILDGKNAKIFNQTNNTLYTKFYQSIISVKFAGIDHEAQPENTADAVIKFELKADQETGEPARTQIVEFAGRDDYTDYVFIDGEYTGCYINRDASFYSDIQDNEGIITAYKMMKYAITHAVDGVFDTEKGYQLD